LTLNEVFQQVAAELGVDDVHAEFYPYCELKHTWRWQGGALHFRVSDYLDCAPDDVLRSLASYLLCRARKQPCPSQSSEPYMRFCASGELWTRKGEMFVSRSRKLRIGTRGAVRDLQQVFDYVNSTYFCGRMTQPILAWTDESPARRLGFYFAPANLLAVNSCFDSESVPRYALEFVMYHELLHHVDAGTGMLHRRIHHTRRFRDQERRFTSYAEAEKWLRRLASRGRRRR